MKKSSNIIIEKMLKYCFEVEIFVKDYEYDCFISDIKTYRATTLTLMQIGELAYNLPIEFKSLHTKIDWTGIAGLRHRLVHDYDGVNNLLIWDIIKNETPKLSVDLKQILENIN